MKRRKLVILAMTIFWINFIVILFSHLLTRTDFHLDFSISKYVGLTFESSIAFLIVNVLVSIAIFYYLAPKLKLTSQKILLAIIVITLVGLSFCPIGLFDNIIQTPIILGRTPISFLHVLFSRTMFVIMAVFSLITFLFGEWRKLYKMPTLAANLIFVIYAAFCILIYVFFPEFFWTFDLIFESIYIANFFLVVASF